MKSGKFLSVVMMLFFVLAITFKTTYAQVDTIPGRDTSISAAQPRMAYIDLYTGTPVDIYYDTVQFAAINRESREPVDYYIITTMDTVHGMTGLIVNNMLIKTPEGKYKLDEDKIKIEGDVIRLVPTEGRRVYWTPEGYRVMDWRSDHTMTGEVKQKTGEVKQKTGDVKKKVTDKKGKIKDNWGTIKWKEDKWKYEREKESM